MLLTREEFRRLVFERDGNKCVLCGKDAVDVHHIMERRLWSDGGYYLDNGASLCGVHHLECESTVISTSDLREACGIKKVVLPDHLYADHVYDKWGNIECGNGRRLKGELYNDEGVQKVMAKSVIFVDYVKYPRTHHFPWSCDISSDDRVVRDFSGFDGKRVIVTEKMDGENTSLYTDHIHARSVDSGGHPSRAWVKNFWGRMSYEIPKGWRICGENMFAEHSIWYDNLSSYFLGFSVWDEHNYCLSWRDTLEWFDLLGIESVPVLWEGVFDEERIRMLGSDMDLDRQEGYVVRLEEGFAYKDFRRCVGKYVRKNHCRTSKHWMMGQRVVPNRLA